MHSHGQYARAPTSDPDNNLFPRTIPTPPESPPPHAKSVSDHDLINIPLSVTSSPDDGEKHAVPKKRSAGGNKLLYLEGLRGLAALWVVNEHFSGLLHLFPSGIVRDTLRLLIAPDALPVPIFYVLSGRVLVNGFIARRDPRMLASAAFRRPFRLGLPIYIALLAHIIFFHAGWYEVADQTKEIVGGWWFGKPTKVGYEMTSVLGFIWAIPRLLFFSVMPEHPVGVTWTIPIEFIQSYSVYLLTFVASFQPSRKYLMYTLALLWSWITLSWSCAFFFGLILAELAHDGHLRRLTHMRRIWIVRAALVAWIGIGILGDLGEHKVDWWLEGVWMKGWLPNPDNGSLQQFPSGLRQFWQYKPRGGSISAAAVVLIEITPQLQTLLSNRFFQFLGKVSFMMYLLHPVMQFSLGSFVLGTIYGRVPDWICGVLTYGVTMGVIFGVSLGAYNVFDEPSVRAGKWLHERLFKP
ncbi:hypothetical protein HK097_009980 [Rhizophlyctis rosea]|uniref:Acyltransferase 3 domain-containing protein n=1 Tax=Rhizophlyctis rosea TaxID=64517 RepID=A0AAD5SG40_9FUNG|nr:hypothetical protein HK097_009980 [Rhizophlyctis rosea]